MAEKLQKDSLVPLEPMKAELTGALAAEDGTAKQENYFIKEGMTGAIVSPVANILLSAGAAAAGMDQTQRAASQNSLFVGGGVSGGKKVQARASMMPEASKSYGEKLAESRQARKMPVIRNPGMGVGECAAVAGMSLTGASLAAGSKPSPIKGIQVSQGGADALRVAELKQDLAVVLRALENPYSSSMRRLEEDFLKGKSAAQQVAQNSSPALIQMIAPKM